VRKFLLVAICFFLCGAAYAENNFSYYGYLKNETALGLNNLNSDLNKQKEIFMLAGEYKVNPDLVFFGKAKYFYDFAYTRDEMDRAAHYMEHVQRTEWLRDCYMDYTNGPWFLRLGKQQIAWGQADGIAILDRVNPVDLREFWLPDMEDIRIPLWMLNINYSPKVNSNLQFLMIPDFEESQAAPPGSPFTFRSYKIFDAFMKTQVGLGRAFDVGMHPPTDFLRKTTWGLQWSDRFGDMDYTLNFLYGPYATARNTTIFNGPANTFNVSRDYKLWRVYGGSFNKTFTKPGPMQGITLRGDFAWYNQEPTYFGNPEAAFPSTSGIVRWDNVFWLIGIDKYCFTKWLVSFQFAQYIMEHGKNKDPSVAAANQFPMNAYTYGRQDPVENIFSLKIGTSSGFMNDRVRPEVLWSFTDDNQGRLSPKVSYEIRDNLVATLGIHYFYGNPQDSNGQFSGENQYYIQMKYSF
jgi:hypothetical protein